MCFTAWHALLTAAVHPDRVQGVVAIAPYVLDRTPTMPSEEDAAAHFDDELPSYDGWYRFNRHHWLADWPDFADFFFGELCVEPHSTKVLEDVVDYALGTTGDTCRRHEQSKLYVETPKRPSGCCAPSAAPSW